MGATYTAFQAFLRRMLQDDSGAWEQDCELVRQKVNALATSMFDQRRDGGATVVSSSIDGIAFSYRIDGRFDHDAILEHATRALASIEEVNPADIVDGFEALSVQDKATYNSRAIKHLRRLLRRKTRTVPDFRAIEH